ncbi:MAG: histidine phosphatase family protein [Flavobacteriales bacterium]|nr:histidine phosphatase family protein [Flavobacteriales bacterium]
MKPLTLHLIRHAKSAWGHSQLDDHDRPLNKRGLRDAPFMAEQFFGQYTCPETWLCSSALRTKTTAHFFAQEAQFPENELRYMPSLYLASYSKMLEIINSIDGTSKDAIVFGHNNGISDTASMLVNENILMPTCSIATIQFELEEWSLVSAGLGTLVQFNYPKQHENE